MADTVVAPSREVMRGLPRARADGTRNGSPGTGNADAGKKLLEALATWKKVDDWNALAVVAGVSPLSGFFYGGKAWLIKNDAVTEKDGELWITGAGVKVARIEPRHIPSLLELAAIWGAKFTNSAAGRIFRYMAEGRAGEYDGATVAKAINVSPTAGYWYGGIAALRRQGILRAGDRQTLQLSPFLEGLRT